MRTSFAAVALAIGAAVTGAPGAPASAATTGPAFTRAPGAPANAATGPAITDGSLTSQLKLTVANGEQASPAQRKATLACDPAGGSHPRAREACAALGAVGGNFGALRVDSGACTMEYDPVTVTAVGRWRGKPVHYQHTFGNPCILRTETGPVFAL